MTKKQLKEARERLRQENPDISEEELDEMLSTFEAEQIQEVEYVCNTRCMFDGVYYREGDVLVTDKAVPEYFSVKE